MISLDFKFSIIFTGIKGGGGRVYSAYSTGPGAYEGTG